MLIECIAFKRENPILHLWLPIVQDIVFHQQAVEGKFPTALVKQSIILVYRIVFKIMGFCYLQRCTVTPSKRKRPKFPQVKVLHFPRFLCIMKTSFLLQRAKSCVIFSNSKVLSAGRWQWIGRRWSSDRSTACVRTADLCFASFYRSSGACLVLRLPLLPLTWWNNVTF